MVDIVYVLIFSLIGFFIGLLTALLPGLHVNTLSILILSMQPLLIDFALALGVYPTEAPVMLASLLTSVYISHTFLNIIPATFLGVPEEDVALAILPSHSLLLKGHAYKAISLSALGSFGSSIFTLLMILPLKFLLSDPINMYGSIKKSIPWVLIAVILIMVVTEHSKRRAVISLSTIFISGFYGMAVMNLPIQSPIGLPTSYLFPALAGLFGLSTLWSSLISKTEISRQIVEEPRMTKSEERSTIISILVGSLSGILVSIVPGVTASIGTVIALASRGISDEKQAIITLSSVNTSAAISTLANLFILQKARSGVAIALSNIISIERWNTIFPPNNLVYLLLSVVLSASLSFPATCYLGKKLSSVIENVPYQALIKISIIFLLVVTFIFSGLLGILILLVGGAVGLIPVFFGARRSSCMGVLLMPLLLHFLGIL